jgi:cellulose synthase/poly-beta-1,6-N-acetylglucosamine synthase-like glycosyltransferase
MVYSFAGYPALMALLARLRPKPWQARGQSSAHEGLSVVLCVHNAATLIRPRLQNLLECAWAGPLEIVVVCDGCTDGTTAAIRELATPQVRMLEKDQRGGKPAGLNLAIPQCLHQVVVLADVRQSFDVEALQKLAAPFADPEVGAVSGLLKIASSETGGGQGVDLYWQLETKLRAWEGQYDSVIGCTGAICAIRRDQYTPLPEDTLLDDVVIPMRLAVNGARIIYEPSARAFDPQKLEPKREKKRKMRTLVGNFQMMERHPAWLLPWRNRLWWQLLSHKYLRLMVPWIMIALAVLSFLAADALFGRVLLAAQGACYGAAILGLAQPKLKLRFLTIPAGFFMLQLSCFTAFFLYLWHRRNLLALWQPASSSPSSVA